MWYSPVNHLPDPGILQLEDLISDQGDIALVIETDSTSPDTPKIPSFSCLPPSPSQTDIALCYFEACGLDPWSPTGTPCHTHFNLLRLLIPLSLP